MSVQLAGEAALRLYNEVGAWKPAAETIGAKWYDLYDLVYRPTTMSRPRRRRAMRALGFSEPARYWRPCLSLSTRDEVTAMLESNPGHTLEDIISCGMEHFENEHG